MGVGVVSHKHDHKHIHNSVFALPFPCCLLEPSHEGFCFPHLGFQRLPRLQSSKMDTVENHHALSDIYFLIKPRASGNYSSLNLADKASWEYYLGVVEWAIVLLSMWNGVVSIYMSVVYHIMALNRNELALSYEVWYTWGDLFLKAHSVRFQATVTIFKTIFAHCSNW